MDPRTLKAYRMSGHCFEKRGSCLWPSAYDSGSVSETSSLCVLLAWTSFSSFSRCRCFRVDSPLFSGSTSPFTPPPPSLHFFNWYPLPAMYVLVFAAERSASDIMSSSISFLAWRRGRPYNPDSPFYSSLACLLRLLCAVTVLWRRSCAHATAAAFSSLVVTFFDAEALDWDAACCWHSFDVGSGSRCVGRRGAVRSRSRLSIKRPHVQTRTRTSADFPHQEPQIKHSTLLSTQVHAFRSFSSLVSSLLHSYLSYVSIYDEIFAGNLFPILYFDWSIISSHFLLFLLFTTNQDHLPQILYGLLRTLIVLFLLHVYIFYLLSL